MATAVWTTIVDRAIGDPITEAIWDDQIKDNGNSLAGAHRNLLTNGGFEVWQRGAGAFTTNAAYTADRWKLQLAGSSTASVTREATTIDSGGTYALAVAYTHNLASSISQNIEDFAALRGKTLSFSMRVRQSVASAVTLNILDGVSGAGSNSSVVTGSFVTLSVTYTMPANPSQLLVYAQLGASGTYYLDHAMLVIGPAPAPYQPLHPQEELARCQRYYEVQGGTVSSALVQGYGAAGANNGNYVSYATRKAGVPTITKNGTWTVVNCGQPATTNGNEAGYTLYATTTALGSYTFAANTTDDTITSEINP